MKILQNHSLITFPNCLKEALELAIKVTVSNLAWNIKRFERVLVEPPVDSVNALNPSDKS